MKNETVTAAPVEELSELKQLDQQREEIRSRLRKRREELLAKVKEITEALGEEQIQTLHRSVRAQLSRKPRKGSLTTEDVLEAIKKAGKNGIKKGQLQKTLKTWPVVLNSRLKELGNKITSRKEGVSVILSAK